VGSKVVNLAASTNLPDAASGFRAYSRASLYRLNVVTQFSYCMETIIQAGNKRMKIQSLEIDTNPKLRESRLFSSTGQHVMKSAEAILRSYIMFKPFVLFAWLGVLLVLGGLIPFVRYAILVAAGVGGNHLQSLIVGVVLIAGAIISFALGVLADLLRTNRILLEETLERIKELQYDPR
jgi:hypothetical protein